MKYLQIKSATSTELGECVLPTMEKRSREYFYGRPYSTGMDSYDLEAIAKHEKEWKAHIDSLPKLDTTCILPAGEWFEGKDGYQWLQGEDFWVGCSERHYNSLPLEHRRKVIVPVEQKDEPKDVPQDTLDLEEIYAVCSTEFGMLEFPWTEGEKGQARLLHFLRSQLTKYSPKVEAGNNGG